MVVGNGLIARSFVEFRENDQVIIFASGVSNSQLKDPTAYQREFDLIRQYSPDARLFVYFSTISVLAPCMQDNIYVQFKQMVERYIIDNFKHYVIFRLPNLVGQSGNPHTLTNFLYEHIISGKYFEIHKHATRYLLDVDHMVQICTYFLEHLPHNFTYDVVLDNKSSMSQIVNDLEHELQKKGNHREVSLGCDISIPPIDQSILDRIHITPNAMNDYNRQLFRKYYSRSSQGR